MVIPGMSFILTVFQFTGTIRASDKTPLGASTEVQATGATHAPLPLTLLRGVSP